MALVLVSRLLVFFKVHYPSFDSNLLISAGNDQRLLVWGQRQFEHQNSSASRLGGGGGSGGGGGGDVVKPKKLKQSGRKKGKTRGATRKASDKAQEREEANSSSAATDESGEAATTESHEDGIVRCTVPLFSMRLEEKPNWITSCAAPYAAIVIADTSPVAKIMRWCGGS